MFGDSKTNGAKRQLVDPFAGEAAGLPDALHLQTVRATTSGAEELLVNLLHVFSGNEQPAASAAPQRADLPSLLAPFRPDLVDFNETTLNGMLPKAEAEAAKMVWKTVPTAAAAEPLPRAAEPAKLAAGGQVSVMPFEFKTFLAKAF